MDGMSKKKDPRTEAIRETIITRLMALCRHKNLSDSALARELKVERQTIYKWFGSKEQVPNEANLIEMAKFFGTSVSYLYGDTDDPRRPDAWKAGLGPLYEWEQRALAAREHLAEALGALDPEKKTEIHRLFAENTSGVEYELGDKPAEAETKPRLRAIGGNES